MLKLATWISLLQVNWHFLLKVWLPQVYLLPSTWRQRRDPDRTWSSQDCTRKFFWQRVKRNEKPSVHVELLICDWACTCDCWRKDGTVTQVSSFYFAHWRVKWPLSFEPRQTCATHQGCYSILVLRCVWAHKLCLCDWSEVGKLRISVLIHLRVKRVKVIVVCVLLIFHVSLEKVSIK